MGTAREKLGLEKIMDIKEIIAAKKEMEMNISDDISLAISEFYKKTGMCPNRISVDLACVQTIGQSSPLYEMGRVTTTLSLD